MASWLTSIPNSHLFIFSWWRSLQNQVGAVVCILLLAFCESFVPTILLSALPQTVHPSVYGAAFGMAEVTYLLIAWLLLPPCCKIGLI